MRAYQPCASMVTGSARSSSPSTRTLAWRAVIAAKPLTLRQPSKKRRGDGSSTVRTGLAITWSGTDVRALLTMPDAVACVEAAMKAQGEAQARNMPRQRIKLPRGTLHMLAGADLTGESGGYVGVKAYTSFREGNRFLTMLYSAG